MTLTSSGSSMVPSIPSQCTSSAISSPSPDTLSLTGVNPGGSNSWLESELYMGTVDVCSFCRNDCRWLSSGLRVYVPVKVVSAPRVASF